MHDSTIRTAEAEAPTPEAAFRYVEAGRYAAVVVVRPGGPRPVTATVGDGSTWALEGGDVRHVAGDATLGRVGHGSADVARRAFADAHVRAVSRAWDVARERGAGRATFAEHAAGRAVADAMHAAYRR